MEIQFSLPEQESPQGIINLKNYIDKAGIEGISETVVLRATHKENEMGAGNILSTLKSYIDAAQKPLTELIKCLQLYVKNYRTEITIPTKNGEKIVLSHGRSMTAEELEKLTISILKNNT